MNRKSVGITLAVLLLASTAQAQEGNGVGSILKKVALDPTTYAPAAIYRHALRQDWATSQPLFERGFVEMNPDFTQDGRVFSTPISPEAGYKKIDKYALGLLMNSAIHNTTSQTLEHFLAKRHPEHKKLIKVLGIVERVAVGGYLTYAASAKHYKQAGVNKALLASGARNR